MGLGGRRHHTAAMGPHSRQQSIQQSTNMLCTRYTLLRLEKNNITINMTIIARRVEDDNATTIASLMVDAAVIRLLWGHSPGNKAYNNQLT
jgi:hypothetical protein